MKELSIEEKAIAYDEAKLRMRAAHNSNRCTIGFMNEIFPELKENKDEEIRKEIIKQINLLKSTTLSDLKVNQFNSWIDWLEKQGKQNLIVVPKFRVGDIVRHIPNEVNMSQVEYRITRIDDKFYYSELEDGVEFILFGFPVEDTWELVEQKPANKIEPKFKIGDWIVSTANIYKIISLNDELNCYIAVTPSNEEVKIPYYFDNGQGHMCSYHLWTIQDAKDGDVLISFCNQPFIYNGKFTKISVGGYCGLDVYGNFIEKSTKECNWTCNEDIKPAAKEQRDLLFQKIKGAGYEWNAEKKELRKIERKPICSEEQCENESLSDIENRIINFAMQFHDNRMKPEAEWEDEVKMLRDNIKIDSWSEEDDKIISEVIQNYENGFLPSVIERDRIVKTLKSLKDHVQPKPEWSEEDEAIWAEISDLLWEGYKQSDSKFSWDDIRNWVNLKLKFFRPQSTWKPSDEQMLAVNTAINVLGKGTLNGKQLIELQEQLKKLKGE